MTALRRAWLFLVACASAALLGVQGYAQRWIGDDGLINIRVVANLLEGEGFVYNLGERVEAVTSPLWVLLLASFGSVGVPLERGAVALGLLLSVAGALLAWLGWWWSWPTPRRALVLPLGGVVYAAVPASWDYATSGLENGLGLAYLGGTFLLVARAAEGASVRQALVAAAVAGLGPLVRPDYALFALAFVLPLLASRDLGASARLGVASAFALPALAFQVFRMGYFAALVPNTALAKEAFEPRWEQGFRYLSNTFLTYALWAPAAVCLLVALGTIAAHARGGRRRTALLFGSTLLAGIAHVAYVVRVGGDFMHGRMLLPGLFCMLLPSWAIDLDLLGAARRLASLVPAAVVVAWAVVCVSSLRVADENYFGIVDERGWYVKQADDPNPTTVDDYERFFFHFQAEGLLARVVAECPALGARGGEDAPCRRVVLTDPAHGRFPRDQTVFDLDPSSVGEGVVAVVARDPLGIAGRVLGPSVHVVDAFGLADPIASRLELAGRGRPGHEKQFSSPWLLGRYGTASMLPDAGSKAVRAAVRCGPLARLVEATRAPMTAGRFFRNIALAFELRALRVPADPREAARRFCGA